jgi:hypothetical protein
MVITAVDTMPSSNPTRIRYKNDDDGKLSKVQTYTVLDINLATSIHRTISLTSITR